MADDGTVSMLVVIISYSNINNNCMCWNESRSQMDMQFEWFPLYGWNTTL